MPRTPNAKSFTPWYWDRIDLFAGLDSKSRGEFMARAQSLSFKRGRHIFRANDRANHAYFLQSGMVKIYDLSANGAVTLFWFCLPGDFLGPGAISGAREQAVHAQVVADATVLAIERTDLEDVICANPKIAINIIRMVGSRLRLVSEMMTESQGLRSEERLARLLLRLAKNWGEKSAGGVRLQIKIPHQEIANMIGSCRQTVNSILRDFQKQGLIFVDRREITLTNTVGLQRVVTSAPDAPALVPLTAH